MPVPQIILFLDGGSIRCEAPGTNGARVKIDLAHDFAVKNPEIMAALGEIADRNKAERDRIALAPKIERVDPEVERRLKNEKIAADKAAKWVAYLDTLSPAERERQIALKVQRDEREVERRLENAKSVWWTMAGRKNQGIAFANEMIPVGRRPRRKIAQNTERKTTSTKTPFNPALVVKITL